MGNGAIANLPTIQCRDGVPLPTLRSQDFRSVVLVCFDSDPAQTRVPQNDANDRNRDTSLDFLAGSRDDSGSEDEVANVGRADSIPEYRIR